MKTYRTAEIARIIGIHPNTVRLYETLGLISAPGRLANGYRVFTELHVAQFRLARKAFQVEILQNGLRKKAIGLIKSAASGSFEEALGLTDSYLRQIGREQVYAEEALEIARSQLQRGIPESEDTAVRTRKETAEYLEITMDTLRNWEMNGLLTVKRESSGYRIYTGADIRQLKMIRSLRCANYSLSAILRMLHILSRDPAADLREAIDTPDVNEEIISVYDKLLTSLQNAAQNAREMRALIVSMKKIAASNPPL